MKAVLILAALVAAPALAQVAKPVDNAAGGATAPRATPQRDAAASRALFDRLDRNRDGYLTGAELTSQEAQRANWLAIDRDGDGRISRDEFGTIPSVQSASAGPTRRE